MGTLNRIYGLYYIIVKNIVQNIPLPMSTARFKALNSKELKYRNMNIAFIAKHVNIFVLF